MDRFIVRIHMGSYGTELGVKKLQSRPDFIVVYAVMLN